MIALIDYKKGNLRSVERGLAACGAEVVVSDEPEDIARAEALVLPGVGAFTDAMATLEETGQADAIRQAVAAGTPFLGICLGMHLMFEAGEEHAVNDPTPGLGLIPGVVGRLPREDGQGARYKIPHVGWNQVEAADDGLFKDIPHGSFFYFTHTFAVPDTEFTCGRTTHSVTFPSAVRRGDAFGVQFHPEKSSDAGMRLLQNFVDLVREG